MKSLIVQLKFYSVLLFHILFVFALFGLASGISFADNFPQQNNHPDDLEYGTNYYFKSDDLFKVPTGCGKGFQKYVLDGLTKEVQPTFPGGDKEMVSYVRRSVVYPDSANRAGVQGTVYVEFLLNEDGHLSNFKVIKSVNYLLDKEALRVVKSFPNWIPGTNNDKPVKVRVSLPIKFRFL